MFQYLFEDIGGQSIRPAAWSLKTRALTEMVYVDEVEVDQEGIAEMLLDESSIAQVARRPITGFVRPSTQSGRPGTMEQAIRTPRTAHTARPVTSASGRFVRLGTASMLTNPEGPFINLSRLNLAKYAQKPNLSKNAQFKDWWWKVQLGKCYYRLGLHRESEKQFRFALNHQEVVDTYLYLAKVYQRLDQPITALTLFKQGLDHFPGEVTLLTGIARTRYEMNNITSATEYYKDVLKQDNTHMGVYHCQLYNNLGLCCFYAQQYDMTLSSFEKALALVANDEEQADVWYNIGHVAVGIGDLTLAYQCFKLALAFNNDHAEAYNNLAVLELRKGHIEQSKAFLQTAASLAPHMYEPHFNYSTLSDKTGDLQSSYTAAQRSEDAFPEHVDTQEILKHLRQHFAVL
ncbi:unnamed protein product [Coregonus sp. 'balchen']|nr:unnamed protein product [Coregonus sp. 'balchen']